MPHGIKSDIHINRRYFIVGKNAFVDSKSGFGIVLKHIPRYRRASLWLVQRDDGRLGYAIAGDLKEIKGVGL